MAFCQRGSPDICLFSWPSDGALLFSDPRAANAIAYKNDRQDAAASGAAFARGFLKVADFINQTEARCQQRLHLTAHSMGNYVLRHALQELRRQVSNQLPRLFDQVLMMAADEDDDAFDLDYKLFSLPRITRRTSVYFNRNDLALWASDKLKGNKYLSKINYTYLTTSCLLPFAFCLSSLGNLFCTTTYRPSGDRRSTPASTTSSQCLSDRLYPRGI